MTPKISSKLDEFPQMYNKKQLYINQNNILKMSRHLDTQQKT